MSPPAPRAFDKEKAHDWLGSYIFDYRVNRGRSWIQRYRWRFGQYRLDTVCCRPCTGRVDVPDRASTEDIATSLATTSPLAHQITIGKTLRELAMKIHTLLLATIVAVFGLAGCDNDDGPAEKAGQAVDNAGQELKDAANDVGNAVEDACEDVKEGVDAEDTDC
jgi:hypothetical protein